MTAPKPTAELYDTVEAMLRDVNVTAEDITNVAFAAGVAAERARIVAALRSVENKADMFAYAPDFADLIDSGWRS
jgi:hypothetical protein